MITYILVSLPAVFLAGFIFAKNPRGEANRSYLFFTVLNILWLSGIVLNKTPSGLLELHFRLLFVFASLMGFFLYKFISGIAGGQHTTSTRILAVGNVILAALSLITPYITESVAVGADGFVVPTRGVVYIPATIWVMAPALLSMSNLWSGWKNEKNSPKVRSQLKFVFIGIALAVFLASLTNFLLPILTRSSQISNYAPASTLFLSFFLGYSIYRHGFLEIKAAVARTVVYAASLASVGLIYTIVVVFLSKSHIIAVDLSSSQRFVLILLSFVTAVIFQPVKVFFDRMTNKVFFRDAYDPQLLTDELNDTLVGGIDLEALLTKSALILQEHMKITFCTFYIRETSYLPSRVIGAHRKDPEIDRMDELHKLSPKLHHKVHTSEPNDDTEVGKKVTDILRRNDIELMVRLVSTLDYEVEGVGYIFLGARRSGGIYSDKDTKFLETIGNELVIAIQNVLRFEEIEHFNVTLQKKIDSATGELQTSNKKLLALDEAKDEFVSMASHQLRTPLTSIKGYVSMVLEGDAGEINKTQKQMLGQALFSSQRMVYLISDLLNVSRLRTGKFLIESRPLQLMDIVESEIHQLQEGAAAKNITLSFSKPDKLPMVDLDDMKIRQVIMNFIDNAIYYTPQGGKIAVELKNRRSSVEFTVKDSGIGVPKDEMHKLFAKFYRAENARKARPDGTGLGLFMAKKVVVALGGSIIFDSKENKGSTFGFTFPKTKKPIKTDKPKTP